LNDLQKNSMPKRKAIKELTLLQIETVAHSLAQEMFKWDEPIPPFVTRFPDKLESCLKTPFQKFDGKSLYRGIQGKGAILFYLMVKNHPFQNGNKRVAVMTLFYFFYKNSRWMNVSNEELYEFAREVAKSDPLDRDRVMQRIRDFIRKNINNSVDKD